MPLWKKLSLSSKSQTFLVDGDAAILEHPIKISHRRRHSHKLPGPKTSPGPLESVNRQAILDPSDHSLVRADDQPCIVHRRRRRRSTLGAAFRNMFSVFLKPTKVERVVSKSEDENGCQMVVETSNRNVSIVADRYVYRFLAGHFFRYLNITSNTGCNELFLTLFVDLKVPQLWKVETSHHICRQDISPTPPSYVDPILLSVASGLQEIVEKATAHRQISFHEHRQCSINQFL